MATIKNTYTGNGTTVVYSLTFPYLRQEHVKVTVNGTLTTAYTFVNSNTIQFNTAPANGAAIVIYRETESDELDNRFFANSSIRAGSLNNNFTQTLYVSQETQDVANRALNDVATAISTAGTALITANSASNVATLALSRADTAINTANTANTNATNAINAVNNASAVGGTNNLVSRDANGDTTLRALILQGTIENGLRLINTAAPANIRRVDHGITSGGHFVRRTFNDAGAQISTDYQMFRDALGALSHVFLVQNLGILSITGSGATVGTSVTEPGNGNTDTGFSVLTSGRLLASSPNTSHSLNRNITTRTGQSIAQIRINGTAVLNFRDYNNGAGIGVVSTEPLFLEGTEVRSERVRDSTTASASNVFIDTTTGRLFRSTSSIKYKKDVEDIDPTFSFNILEKSRPVWFRSSVETEDQTHGHWGLIAEEVAEYDPRLVHFGLHEDGTLEPEGVQYERIIPHLLVILKQQQSDILELQVKVEQLQQAQSQPES